MMFATIFAVYIVLSNNTFGGPSAHDLFYLPTILVQTLILLIASVTSDLGGVFAHRKEKKKTLIWFVLTFLLGFTFMWMGLSEFSRLIAEGSGWQRSGFLSAYFTLVGTHIFHIVFALLWTLILLLPVWREGLTPVYVKRLTCLRMFWQFLNVVWIFIFSFVYLMGVK